MHRHVHSWQEHQCKCTHRYTGGYSYTNRNSYGYTNSYADSHSHGYTSVFWTFCYEDWVVDKQMEPSKALKLMKDQAHNGAIYLIHGVSSTNAEVLGDLIDYLKAEGYSMGLLEAK